jgi:hypothetical protein
MQRHAGLHMPACLDPLHDHEVGTGRYGLHASSASLTCTITLAPAA